jgi:hypothetical protein
MGEADSQSQLNKAFAPEREHKYTQRGAELSPAYLIRL